MHEPGNIRIAGTNRIDKIRRHDPAVDEHSAIPNQAAFVAECCDSDFRAARYNMLQKITILKTVA